MHDQDEQRQHRQAGKDVRQKHAGKPGQRRGQDQCEADHQQPQRPGHAQHAQRQLQDPERRQRLNPEIDPEAANPRRNAGRGRTPWNGWGPDSPHTIAPDSRRYPIGAADSRSKAPARAASREWRRRRSRPRSMVRARARKICVLMLLPPVSATMPGLSGCRKSANSRRPDGLISSNSRPLGSDVSGEARVFGRPRRNYVASMF